MPPHLCPWTSLPFLRFWVSPSVVSLFLLLIRPFLWVFLSHGLSVSPCLFPPFGAHPLLSDSASGPRSESSLPCVSAPGSLLFSPLLCLPSRLRDLGLPAAPYPGHAHLLSLTTSVCESLCVSPCLCLSVCVFPSLPVRPVATASEKDAAAREGEKPAGRALPLIGCPPCSCVFAPPPPEGRLALQAGSRSLRCGRSAHAQSECRHRGGRPAAPTGSGQLRRRWVRPALRAPRLSLSRSEGFGPRTPRNCVSR